MDHYQNLSELHGAEWERYLLFPTEYEMAQQRKKARRQRWIDRGTHALVGLAIVYFTAHLVHDLATLLGY